MSKSYRRFDKKTLFIIRETRQLGVVTEEHLFIKLSVEKKTVGYYENISSQCFRRVTFTPEAVESFSAYKSDKPVKLPGGEFYPDYVTRLIVDLTR